MKDPSKGVDIWITQVGKDLSKSLAQAGKDTSRALNEAGKALDKAGKDAGEVFEKAGEDTAKAFEQLGKDTDALLSGQNEQAPRSKANTDSTAPEDSKTSNAKTVSAQEHIHLEEANSEASIEPDDDDEVVDAETHPVQEQEQILQHAPKKAAEKKQQLEVQLTHSQVVTDKMLQEEFHRDVKPLAKETAKILEIQQDTAELLGDSARQLETIEKATEKANEYTESAVVELTEARKEQKEVMKLRLILGLVASTGVSIVATVWLVLSIGSALLIPAAVIAGAAAIAAAVFGGIFGSQSKKKSQDNGPSTTASLFSPSSKD